MPRRSQAKQRLLTTVLFTDIVGSTQHAAELGDRRWRQLLARHHAVVRRLLKRYGGREIDTAGDGFFATFDQPAQAIECAVSIGRGVRPLGIEVRAGIHMGEVEITVDNVAGIAVHIGSRVMSTAGPGEVMVSNTVRDLLSGSEFRFEDRGPTQLKGVPGEWRLSAVTDVPHVEEYEEEAVPAETAPTRRGRLAVPLTALIVIGVVAVLVIPPLVSGGGKTGGLPAPAVDTIVRLDPSTDEVLGAIRIGRTPIAVATGEGMVWVANFDDGTIQSVDPSTNIASPAIGLGFDQAPSGIAVGGGFVWITCSTTGVLFQYDPGQSHRFVPVDLGVGVTGVAYGEGAVWVTNSQSETVLRIDPENPKAVPRTIELEEGSRPAGIAVGAGSVWVAESLKGVVARIDTNRMEVVGTVPLLQGDPDQVAFGEGFVWASVPLEDAVLRIDPLLDQGTTITGVGNSPAGIAAADGFAWVANGLDGTVAKIDPRTSSVIVRYQLGSGLSADGVALTDGAVWVSVHSP
jgi:class 3 adenylate cyclase/streptogramin lyase